MPPGARDTAGAWAGSMSSGVRVETPIESLVSVAASSSDRLAFGYPRGNGEALDASLTTGELCRRAETAAAGLLRSANPGDRVLLTGSPGPAFAMDFSVAGARE